MGDEILEGGSHEQHEPPLHYEPTGESNCVSITNEVGKTVKDQEKNIGAPEDHVKQNGTALESETNVCFYALPGLVFMIIVQLWFQLQIYSRKLKPNVWIRRYEKSIGNMTQYRSGQVRRSMDFFEQPSQTEWSSSHMQRGTDPPENEPRELKVRGNWSQRHTPQSHKVVLINAWVHKRSQ